MTHLNHQPCPYIDCGSSDAFSWNTEKQVGYCNSCGKGYPTKHMSVHSWAKEQYPLKELDKVQAVQSFSKPQAVSYREDYFGYRGITYDTMKFYKCLTQFDEANNPISHKYVYPSGSIKTRVFPKSFHVASGFKSDELFGMNLFGPGSAKAVTITEGECFTPDAEVLTPHGWKSLSEITDSDNVAQVEKDGFAGFVKPVAIINKYYKGDLVEYRSGSYYSLTTPEHNLVRNHPKQGYKKFPANVNSFFTIPRVADAQGWCGYTLEQLQIWIMLSADFTFRESGDIYGAFKKKRKIERLKYLLDNYGVRYSCNEVGEGYTSVFIHRGHRLGFAKKDLPWSMVWSQHKRELLEEVIFWDGNRVKGKNQAEFSTNRQHNADVVQALSHSCGYVSSIIRRENAYGSWLKVSILFGKSQSSTQKGYKVVPYAGRVMCVQVPSGMLLVRQKGSVSVSGNCDAMSAFQMLGSKYPVVSLPSATPGRKLLENCKDWLGSFEKIYLSVDTDEKADKFCLALLDLFPGRVYKVHHGKLKDANEFLTANKVREYVSAWWASPKYTPQNFVSSPHQWEEVLTTEEPYEYKPTPISGLNKITKGFVKGGITVIKALPGTGKTALFRFFEHDLIKNQSARVAVLHMEEMKSTTGRGLASYELGKNVMTKEDAKANGVTEKQVIDVVKELTKDSQFVTFEIDPHDALGSVISCIQTAISVYDVDYIFIDHLQRLAYLSGVDNATASLTELAVKMVDLSKRRNVGIIAISHVNEGGASKYAKAIEEEAIIVMEIERDKFSEDMVARNTTKITVTKNRPFALTGDAGEVYYDPETTLLCERGDSW